ncbi:hypothetical protein NDU88_004228 [Pleurodeles waltl]|uniref:Uncharacterized protein n=1 Tax=Pleurodeles waltl TaxID=8319 RepID=A0AAV7VFL1_PLEWA|nr:hypothetical protein NDU88_004228 [Pleurodeles waltl]
MDSGVSEEPADVDWTSHEIQRSPGGRRNRRGAMTRQGKLCTENNEPSVKPIQDTENMLEIKDREIKEKELGPLTGSNHLQTQQSDQIEQPEPQSREGTVSTTGPVAERVDQHEVHGSPKRWGKTTGKDSQLVDWGKDSSDKFYSLTEESDPSSVDYSLSESEDSETSAAGNKSSAEIRENTALFSGGF